MCSHTSYWPVRLPNRIKVTAGKFTTVTLNDFVVPFNLSYKTNDILLDAEGGNRSQQFSGKITDLIALYKWMILIWVNKSNIQTKNILKYRNC